MQLFIFTINKHLPFVFIYFIAATLSGRGGWRLDNNSWFPLICQCYRRGSPTNNSSLTWQIVPRNQSAYRQGHSTDTAILKLHDAVINATADGRMVLLCLLDLSAASNGLKDSEQDCRNSLMSASRQVFVVLGSLLSFSYLTETQCGSKVDQHHKVTRTN